MSSSYSYASVLVNRLASQEAFNGPKPTAMGTRLRHSDAAKCSRYIALQALQVPPSDPMDLAGVWVTTLGTKIHELWQHALEQAAYADEEKVEIEPKVGWPDFEASGHLDALVTLWDDSKTCVELKTMGGAAYKRHLGIGPNGQRLKDTSIGGPKMDHVTQLALNTVAADASVGVLVYFATEAISKGLADRLGIDELGRFASEYHYPRETLQVIADEEKQRLSLILHYLDQGVIADRFFEGKIIADPNKVQFPCGYCSQLTNCLDLGEKARVEDAEKIFAVSSSSSTD